MSHTKRSVTQAEINASPALAYHSSSPKDPFRPLFRLEGYTPISVRSKCLVVAEMPGRKLCITAIDGNTGRLIAELFLTDQKFSRKMDSVVGLRLEPNAPSCKELAKLALLSLPIN